jgi:hypothetical protein
MLCLEHLLSAHSHFGEVMSLNMVRASLLAAFCISFSGGFPANASAPEVFIPSAVALPKIPSLSVAVTQFGAIANDGLDDAKAIQRALDAVHAKGGGTLIFAKGQYDLTIDPKLRRALTIYPRMRWLGAVGAAIRLADHQPIYESILAPASYPTRLDDIEFVGLTFDANGLTNPVLDPLETNGDAPLQRAFPTLRFVIRSFVGARARIANSTFINNDNGNTISFNGNDVSDVTIERCQFLNVGSATIDHDHSSVYLYATRYRIVHNEFRSRNGAGTLGARTAYETHGDDAEASDNLVDGFLQGVNVVGRMSNTSRQLHARNQFLNVAVGINIWPLADHLVGDAFTSLSIINNAISIDADAWWRSPAMVVNHTGGIHFESDIARGPIERMEVAGNHIIFESSAGKSKQADRFSAGIDIRGVEDVLRVRQLTIMRNTIRNAVGPCVLSAAIVGAKSPSVIADNTLTDCGRSANLKGEGNVLRSGIVIAGKATNLSVTGNAISATGATPETFAGIVIGADCQEQCAVRDNLIDGIESSVRNVSAGWDD